MQVDRERETAINCRLQCEAYHLGGTWVLVRSQRLPHDHFQEAPDFALVHASFERMLCIEYMRLKRAKQLSAEAAVCCSRKAQDTDHSERLASLTKTADVSHLNLPLEAIRNNWSRACLGKSIETLS
jgi:hypothetical protein